MPKAHTIILIFSSILALATFATAEVVQLNGDDFQDKINSFDFTLVKFYAPWCGHCKSLAPEYTRAAEELAQSAPNARLAEVDLTAKGNEHLAQTYEIRGYPTLKWFVKGSLQKESPNSRKKDDIVQWVKKMSGPKVTLIKDLEALQAATQAHFSAVAFLDDPESEASTNFHAAAASDLTHDYYAVYDTQLSDSEDASPPTLVFYRDFDEPKVVSQTSFQVENISAEVALHSRPRLIPFSDDNPQTVFQHSLHKVFLFKPNTQTMDAIREVSDMQEHRSKYIFATVAQDSAQRLQDYLGVSQGDQETQDQPELFLLTHPDMKKYRIQGPFDSNDILAFLQGFEQGTAPRFLKSAPVIPGWDSNPVKEITSSQWQDFVTQDKHVIVAVYAPWCGHCKKLEPEYLKAAEQLLESHPDDVVLAKMDGTANEVEGIDVQGFPSVFAFPKHSKALPTRVSADFRETKDILHYAKKTFALQDKKQHAADELKATRKKLKHAIAQVKGSLQPVVHILEEAIEEIQALKHEKTHDEL